ncbi:metallophosphoesterase [Coraliomargarita sp. SDUM461004]|uniref:Metallophosphoesterase n=1 Tax=Thalassobacterium sedimentorum TaxID=3041258 RepID=A0ABU1AM02_9BACT|nr:metallophosphoesterase [Coraliomargarita sp. SDUM461004]MDQ8195808.1 metallophosphoesterase [Coraliomargarita sp. SDUM461004]
MPTSEDLRPYAARLGETEFAARMAAEKHMRDHRGEGQGKGIFRLEHKWDTYALIRFCLKISGFWQRAVRNYFDIKVVRNEVRLANLPAEFDGYTILQLTDLHADLHPDFPARVKEVIAPLNYDCMALTGDYRTCIFGDHSGATAATIDIISEVEQPIFATLGNHDCLAKVPAMEAAGIRFLLNEHAVLRRGGAELYLIGIDDPNFYRTHCFERSLLGVPARAVKVLLSHSPQTYAIAAEMGIDFLMAGHTHGGQICLPGGYVLIHDGSSPRHILAGRWSEGNLQGYTSRGTGASGLPARLNCPSEVTLHTLRCC